MATDRAYSTAEIPTRRDAAKRLAVCEKTVDKLAAEGRLPRLRIGGATRFRAADVTAFIEAAVKPAA